MKNGIFFGFVVFCENFTVISGSVSWLFSIEVFLHIPVTTDVFYNWIENFAFKSCKTQKLIWINNIWNFIWSNSVPSSHLEHATQMGNILSILPASIRDIAADPSNAGPGIQGRICPLNGPGAKATQRKLLVYRPGLRSNSRREGGFFFFLKNFF